MFVSEFVPLSPLKNCLSMWRCLRWLSKTDVMMIFIKSSLMLTFHKNHLWSQRSFLIILFIFSFINSQQQRDEPKAKKLREMGCSWGEWQRRTQRKIGVLFGERKPRNTTTTPWRREHSREEPSLCYRGVAREGCRGRQFLLPLWCCQKRSPSRPRDTEWRRPWSGNLSLFPPFSLLLRVRSLSLSVSLCVFYLWKCHVL